MKKYTVVYHKQCPDGLTAASVLKLHLQEENCHVSFIAADFGDNSVSATNWEGSVYLVDFCYSPEDLTAIAKKVYPNPVVVLDHHASAVDNLKGWTSPSNVFITLDMSKSGCRLAWDWCYPDKDPHPLVKFVEDRDLWKFTLPHTNSFCAWLDSKSQSLDTYFSILQDSIKDPSIIDNAIIEGKHMHDKFIQSCLTIAKDAYPIEIDGVKGLAVCTSNEFHSQVGNMLAMASGSFGLCWYLRNDTFVKCGIRSNGLDVKAIASKFGGGGHTQASAFRGGLKLLTQLYSGVLKSDPLVSRPCNSEEPRVVTVDGIFLGKFSDSTYEGSTPEAVDFYIVKASDGSWDVDLFDGTVEDAVSAYITSFTARTLREAARSAYDWKRP